MRFGYLQNRAAIDGPPAVASDPDFASVRFLCAFDGADGATSATDDSSDARTITFAGNAQIDTAQSKFGGASLLLDGTGDWVTLADSADWVLDAAFTIEGWIRIPSTIGNNNYGIMHQWGGVGARSWGVKLFRAGTTSRQISFDFSTDGTNVAHSVAAAWNPTLVSADDTFVHWCAERDGSDKIRVYVDGVMLGSKSSATGTSANSTAALGIGQNFAGNVAFNGHIDEVRITKGVARYASDSGFTPPTAAFPRS